MHFFLLLISAILFCSTAANAGNLVGYAYYPSEKNPEYLLKLSGTVVNGKVAVKEAFLTPKLVSGTLSVTAAGQKIGMDGAKLGSRLGLGLQVNVNHQIGFHSNAADVSIFYPAKLTTMPSVTLRAKSETLKSTCKRDPSKNKPNNVDASVIIPPNVANSLNFGDQLTVMVHDESNNMLEQATFKVCPKQAYNQMLTSAIQTIINKDVAANTESANKKEAPTASGDAPVEAPSKQ